MKVIELIANYQTIQEGFTEQVTILTRAGFTEQVTILTRAGFTEQVTIFTKVRKFENCITLFDSGHLLSKTYIVSPFHQF